MASPIFRFERSEAAREKKNRAAAVSIELEYRKKFVVVRNWNGDAMVERRKVMKPSETPEMNVRLAS